jgi:hypothetical protein
VALERQEVEREHGADGGARPARCGRAAQLYALLKALKLGRRSVEHDYPPSSTS